jgi:hypothetical protein
MRWFFKPAGNDQSILSMIILINHRWVVVRVAHKGQTFAIGKAQSPQTSDCIG